jgi:hypothetical protein
MNMPIKLTVNTYDKCRGLEMLTSDITGNAFGYSLGGGRPGPNVLVAGFHPHIDQLFERFSKLPTLSWMWGV